MDKAAAMPTTGKLTKAQIRALAALALGPLTVDKAGALAWDGPDGSRHMWAPVWVLFRRGLAKPPAPEPHQRYFERMFITDAGRTALSAQGSDGLAAAQQFADDPTQCRVTSNSAQTPAARRALEGEKP